MKSAFVRRRRSAATALCAVVAAIALSGCGGSDGTTPTSRQAFTGNFAGTMALDSPRMGAVSLTSRSDTTATGTLTITGGTTPETVPLTGFVELVTGNFSLSGNSADGLVTATVSGTLPGLGGGSDVLVIQIGTTMFRGTIAAA